MHRIVMPDGTTRQSQYLRVALATAYALFAVAGVCFLLSPRVSPILFDTLGDAAYVYSAFMLVGAVGASVGSATMRWVGEFTGLPLLGTGIASFGIEAMIHGYAARPYLSTAVFCLFIGLGLIITARWRVSLASYRFAHHVALVRKAMEEEADGG